ncbi:MAG: MarR family transcriptional regulator [Endomicrobiia bacterium]|nr:MarR family transcriptional regulator [Endomicrobiia bacterium]
MPSILSAVENDFINAVSMMGASMGLNRVVGQIYALLFLKGEPMSLDDICEALNISKGNVSINIRELERWGAVKKSWTPGSRKDYYDADDDVVGVVYGRMRMRFEKIISELGENLEKWGSMPDLSPPTPSRGKSSGNGRSNARVAKKIGELRRIKEALDAVLGNMPREVSGDSVLKKIAVIGKLKSLLS